MSLVLLILACLVLEALIGLRPWARVVMLVVGWITVVSAAINLLALPASSAFLAPLVGHRGGDWAALLAVSALTKAADLAFSLIRVKLEKFILVTRFQEVREIYPAP